jgi:aminoglycoside 2''-phosphotransferase
MHNVDISGSGTELPSTSAPVHRDTWLDIRHRVQEKVYPLLLKHQIQWADKLFDSMLAVPNAFDFTPVLIHGDLASYHILFDPHENKVTGVIDFGVAGKGDAALDLGNLMTTYGESFIQLMRPTYPVLEIYLPRARFYAQSIELQWVLLGLENGETFWFTAHLGGARDVGF